MEDYGSGFTGVEWTICRNFITLMEGCNLPMKFFIKSEKGKNNHKSSDPAYRPYLSKPASFLNFPLLLLE